MAQQVKNPPVNAGDVGLIPGSGRSLGEGNSYSSILAWRIPWTEEPGGLQPMKSQRVIQNWSEWACMHTGDKHTHTHTHTHTLYILNLGSSLSQLRELVMDREAQRAAIHGVAKSRTRLSDWSDLTTPMFQGLNCSWEKHWKLRG